VVCGQLHHVALIR